MSLRSILKTLRRWIDAIKSWFGIVQGARRGYARRRTRVVRAIVRRNELQQMVDDLQKKIDSLHAEAELTLQCGSHAQHAQLLKEKQGYEISFQVIQASLEKAALLVEAIKRDIQRDQDDILRRRK